MAKTPRPRQMWCQRPRKRSAEAEQTNLLALNVTIEAARTGVTGKGFAEISIKIQAFQSDTGNAVDAIKEISEIINQINDFSSSIASAVEEQSATTSEMTRNVADAAKRVSEIAENILGVSSAAE